MGPSSVVLMGLVWFVIWVVAILVWDRVKSGQL
jgi:hypothetical protein